MKTLSIKTKLVADRRAWGKQSLLHGLCLLKRMLLLGYFPPISEDVKQESSNKISILTPLIFLVCFGSHYALANIAEPSTADIEEGAIYNAEGIVIGFGPIHLLDMSDPILEDRPAEDKPLDPAVEGGEENTEEALLEEKLNQKEMQLAYQWHGPFIPYYTYGNVCRRGGWWCYHSVLPVGSSCSCWNVLGFLWFVGHISTW